MTQHLDLAELRRVAEAARKWALEEHTVEHEDKPLSGPEREMAEAYLMATRPDVVLALLDALDAAVEMRKRFPSNNYDDVELATFDAVMEGLKP